MTRERDRIEMIQGRLHDHERELGRTLESIRERMTSRQLASELFDRASESGYPQALGRAFRDNPIPTVLAGVCAAWLAKSARDAIAGERRAQEKAEAQRRQSFTETQAREALRTEATKASEREESSEGGPASSSSDGASEDQPRS